MDERDRTAIPCIKCGETMFRQVFQGRGQMWKCASCTGMWLDTAMCALLMLADLEGPARDFIRSTRPPQVQAQPAGGYRQAARRANATGALYCPECEAELRPFRTDPQASGVSVQLDICDTHGTWFDKGEAVFLLTNIELTRLASQLQVR